ncbi:DEAD-domain-containing protein [Choiromyces venosus 120613-1]|uniref:ATP-dependent RNA helicase n=1 Tax=Choiromyces venosus 120613-1 TaxID=1336337 RepID=A0A3N4IXU2_9PEZI|nr:DEAD-domain-containing protein [Choiromyces venosus 120613-1]
MEDSATKVTERKKGRVKDDGKKKRKREKVDVDSGREGEEELSEKRAKKEKKERKKEKKEKKERKKKRRKSEVEVGAKVEEGDAEAQVQIEDEENKTKKPTPPTEELSEPKKKREKKKKRKSEVDPESTEVSEPAPLPKHLSILEKLRKVKERVSSTSTPTTDAPATTEAQEQLPAPAGLEPIPQPPLTKSTKPPIPLSSALPPWLANPITINPTSTQLFSEITCISPKLQSRLSALSMNSAFAVQSAVIPRLLSIDGGDMCISAATGSGKTLAYVLPIIQALSNRVVTRLRAVVVVPTRELVSQVHSVARSLSTGTGLKIGTAVGSKALSLEQAQLVDEEEGASKVDVLVCTPGRLVEHIKTTKGFTLRYLKWLVIDEADRLLAQSFQEWVSTLIGEIERGDVSVQGEGMERVLEDLGIRRKPPGSSVRKVVLSATMTRDAGKLSDLKLRKACMISVESEPPPVPQGKDNGEGEEEEETFTLPPTLQELLIPITDTSLKPLTLVSYLLTLPPIPQVLIFTSSNTTATRLSTLLSSFSSHPSLPPTSPAASWLTQAITSETPQKHRTRSIRAFKKREVGILVCSDLVARGLDIENVEVVMNYEVPVSVRGYVHRVGRTARAGRKGLAVSLVGEKEAGWFWKKVGGKGVRRSSGIEKVGGVEFPGEGMGWRGVFEQVLYG